MPWERYAPILPKSLCSGDALTNRVATLLPLGASKSLTFELSEKVDKNGKYKFGGIDG